MQEPSTSITQPSATPGPRFVRSGGNGAPPPPPKQPKPRLKKLRLALVVLGLSVLALISTVFGMLMAVASDLPSLDNEAQYRAARNSVLYPRGPDCPKVDPDKCPQIGKLTGNLNRILVTEGDISPNLKNAVIAIEDRRFYTHHGVDYTGIARALWQDVLRRKAAQGGSTITQQFVKNALSAQNDRSVFQKLREAALAYHLERKWSKEKILTQYLNTVYFGNGAYGVEAAARTYFGDGDGQAQPATTPTTAGVTAAPPPVSEEDKPDPNRRDARVLSPADAALLAGMISSPSMYDPLQHPVAARQRRDLVLSRMLDQKMITRAEYDQALRQAVPSRDQVNPPHVDSDYPYFTSWVEGQLLDQFPAPLVYSGGLNIQTTIDPELQAAAEQAIRGRLAGIGPSASLVAIDNKTGQVRAMVGGTDFDTRPFNLATNGHRQPGSSIKPFILVRALADGADPNSTWVSARRSSTRATDAASGGQLPGEQLQRLVLRDRRRSGSATTNSDNSVFAELGLKTGTKRIARLAREDGHPHQALDQPVDDARWPEGGRDAARDGLRVLHDRQRGRAVTSSLAPDVERRSGSGGQGVEAWTSQRGGRFACSPADVGELAQPMLHLVVKSGTAKAAQVGEYTAGKTGTTENYGDAWFVGGNEELTVAVWVGYADKAQSMKTEHAGSPVAGGTFPAEIFHDFMSSWIQMRDARDAEKGKDSPDHTFAPPTPYAPQQPPPRATRQLRREAATTRPRRRRRPEQKAPSTPPRTPAPAPAPSPTPAPGGGGGGGGGRGRAERLMTDSTTLRTRPGLLRI